MPVRPAAKADHRVALVTGNSTFVNASRLPNTTSDANEAEGYRIVTYADGFSALDASMRGMAPKSVAIARCSNSPSPTTRRAQARQAYEPEVPVKGAKCNYSPLST